MATSNRTIRWIENLAEQELSATAGNQRTIDILETKEEVLQLETVAFMRELFHHVEYLVKLFNQKVNQASLQMKLLRLGDNLEGFTMSRNRMRLTTSAARPGGVQLSCEKVEEAGLRSVRGVVMFSGLIEAKFGTFHDVEWSFLGNPVTPELVARHYLTEFIQTSRMYCDN